MLIVLYVGILVVMMVVEWLSDNSGSFQLHVERVLLYIRYRQELELHLRVQARLRRAQTLSIMKSLRCRDNCSLSLQLRLKHRVLSRLSNGGRGEQLGKQTFAAHFMGLSLNNPAFLLAIEYNVICMRL
jgi:hypothetical protein